MADSEIELDAETDNDEPKKKKQKVLQKYLPGYQIKYPVIRLSSVSDNHAYCTVCRYDFSVGHGCIGDDFVVGKNCCKRVKLAHGISALGASLSWIPVFHFQKLAPMNS